MKTFLTILLVFVISPMLFAGTIQSGPDGHGGRLFELNGCTTIANITDNMKGYRVYPQMTRLNWIVICDNNKYSADDMVGIMEKVAEKALAKNCFRTTINRSSWTVDIEYLPGIKMVKRRSVSSETYSLDGYAIKVDMKISDQINNLCVLDPSGLENPYEDLLKGKTE